MHVGISFFLLITFPTSSKCYNFIMYIAFISFQPSSVAAVLYREKRFVIINKEMIIAFKKQNW